jgi:hypothetical protein
MTSDDVRDDCIRYIGSTVGRKAFVELQTANYRLRVYSDAFAILNVLDQPVFGERQDSLLRRLLQRPPSQPGDELIARLLFVGLLPHLKQIHALAWRAHGPCERWNEIYLAVAEAALPPEQGKEAPDVHALLQRVRHHVWSLENRIRGDREFATLLPPEDIERLCTAPAVDLQATLMRFASEVVSKLGAEDALFLWTVYDRGYNAIALDRGVEDTQSMRERVCRIRRALGCNDSHHIG